MADVRLEAVGQWGGSSYAVTVAGNLAYLGVGPRVVILDISDPNNPQRLGQTIVMPSDPPEPGEPGGIAIQGNYMYVAAAYTDLQIFDISDPAAPVWLSRCEVGEQAWAIAVAGEYAYVGDYGYQGRLAIVNIADPGAPYVVGACPTTDSVTGVALWGQYAFVSQWCGGLDVIDISQPNSPVRVANFADGSTAFASGIALAGHYVYLANCSDGVQIIDVSAPLQPVHIGGTPEGLFEAEDVRIAGDYAYVADSWNGLTILDVSAPLAPSIVAQLAAGPLAQTLALSGPNVLLADWVDGLDVIDVSTPAEPARLGHYDEVNHALNVGAAGGFAYVTGYGQDVQVIDARDAANAHRAATIPGQYGRVCISGQYAYVPMPHGAPHGGVFDVNIVDVSDETHPVYLGTLETPSYVNHICVSGDLAYIADHDCGLIIANVADPSAPFAVSVVGTGVAYGVVYDSGSAYVADADAGLVVVDVHDPYAPSVVASVPPPAGSFRDIAFEPGFVYLGGYSRPDLQVFDIADPRNPLPVGSYITGAGTEALSSAGCYVYIADPTGLTLFDVRDAAQPVQVAYLRTTGYPYDVAVDGGYAYVADGEGGLTIVAVYIPGDLNCDGLINGYDIDPFVLALTNPAAYLAAYPECHAGNADCNADGAIDAFDIDPFVELLTGN